MKSTPSTSTSTSKTATISDAQTRQGLRSQLFQLLPLPRHALFHVRVRIHQLHNVPYIGGEFAVKWKFQNAHAIGGPGLLERVKARRQVSGGSVGKGKGRVVEDEENSIEDDESSLRDTTTVVSHSSSSTSRSLASTTPSASSRSSPTEDSHTYPLSHTPPEMKSESRGRTDYADLEGHNIKWDHTIDVGVQMSVHRETLDLLPSELKLVVMQHVKPGDPDALQNPRLGALYLNLAEYANLGPIERRYLLRESKINATLQLTIELTHIGGEKVYHPPPLQKGEVMARVTGLLQNDNTTDPYGTLGRQQSRGKRGHVQRNVGIGSLLPEEARQALRTTDNIIEAIFNPVPTSSPVPSPFTYYVPPKPKSTPSTLSVLSAPSDSVSEASDPQDKETTSDAAPSVSAHSDNSHLAVDAAQSKKWWKKLGSSRPCSPLPPMGTQESPRTAVPWSKSPVAADHRQREGRDALPRTSTSTSRSDGSTPSRR